MMTMMPKTTVSSAAANATRSAPARRANKYAALAIPHTKADRNMTIADGTWK